MKLAMIKLSTGVMTGRFGSLPLTLSEYGHDGRGHGLWPPRLEWAALAEPQVLQQALLLVPRLLPGLLQLVLERRLCNIRRGENGHPVDGGKQ